MAGEEEFNEVLFEDVFVPEDMLVGTEGGGWKQVTAELAFERSGPERYHSSIQPIVELIRAVSEDPSERAAGAVGRRVAPLAGLHLVRGERRGGGKGSGWTVYGGWYWEHY